MLDSININTRFPFFYVKITKANDVDGLDDGHIGICSPTREWTRKSIVEKSRVVVVIHGRGESSANVSIWPALLVNFYLSI